MFDDFVRIIEKRQLPIYGIEVFLKGEVIKKHDFVSEARHPIYSATKTFVTTAAGFAVQEGKFSVDRPIFDYLKDVIPTEISDSQLNILKQIPVKQFMCMSVEGYPFRPQGEDWLKFSLLCPIKGSKKSNFAYSNLSAYLVGVALEFVVGEHLMDYLKPRLFDPLDISEPIYKNCPSGHFYGGSGMELTVNELSRLGQIYLENGCYRGKRILKEEWMKEATDIHQINQEGGYGYFIWKYRDGFRISGKWGQRCFIFPDRKCMITYLSDLQEGSKEVQYLMEQEILPYY